MQQRVTENLPQGVAKPELKDTPADRQRVEGVVWGWPELSK